MDRSTADPDDRDGRELMRELAWSAALVGGVLVYLGIVVSLAA